MIIVCPNEGRSISTATLAALRRLRWVWAALLLCVALSPHSSRALPPTCHNESVACVLNGKVGEKFCTNGRWSACVVQGGQPAGPPPFDPRCSDRSATGVIKCVIEQPDVRHHETDYRSVVFAPNDTVYVEADGCVQSGGFGNTWHRYVNPTGPDSGSNYHGLIRIPTGTPNSALVRISEEIEKPIVVTGAGVDLSTLFLHLGFEDSDYSDNGYNDHDDGPDDQCAYQNGGYPAAVVVTIFRGVKATPPASRFDFDVVSTNPPDPNGLMYNPLWSWQLRPENAGKTPDTSTCHNFSVRGSTLGVPDPYLSPSFSDCTDQADATSVDLRQMCQLAGQFQGDGFGGHVNWFPVTVEGNAWWGDHSGLAQQIFGDDDYTFSFISDVAGNPLSVNGRPGLHVEFDSDETIDHFTTSEWSAFHDAVDNDNKDLAEQYFDGHTILTGMYGLDTDHMKAELHPLFALATRRDAHSFENGAGDEAWLMFVRNVGDEGFCSYKLWSAEFEDYTFRLPWRPGMTSVQVDWGKTSFEGTDGTSGPVIRAVPPTFPRNPASEGVFVTFHLGPVSGFPLVDGALHLIWSGPVATERTAVVGGFGPRTAGGGRRALADRSLVLHAAVARPADDDEADDIERKFSVAVKGVEPAQRTAIGAARASAAAARPSMHRLASGSMAVGALPQRPELMRRRVAIAPRRHAVSVGPATAKLARDAAMMQALCTATHDAPAGFPPGLCAARNRIESVSVR